MKYVIVYWSRYGNGKKIVTTLADKLKKKDIETQLFTTDEANPTSMPEADLYIFSTPTEAFRVQKNMRTFMKGLSSVEGKKYGIINTHGMDRNWLGSMEKLLSKKHMIKVAGVDFKVGKTNENELGLLDNWEAKLDEFAQKLS